VISRMAPMVGIAPQPGVEIDLPPLPDANTERVAKAKPPVATRQAVYRPDARPKRDSWADDVARAVGLEPRPAAQLHQTKAEADLVLRARKALTRAVTAREQHRQLLSTAVSLVERDVASR
jgi:hypothetical protein